MLAMRPKKTSSNCPAHIHLKWSNAAQRSIAGAEEESMIQYPKRLIEVDLPIKRISEHARREKSIRHGHISTLHIWWARRPLAACRAVICAALWPDPADENCPRQFREAATKIILDFARKVTSDTKLATEHCSAENFKVWRGLVSQPSTRDSRPAEIRSALLDFIADFANWDNSTVREYLDSSRALTQAAHEALGGAPGTRPLVVDPFAGGGSIPLEALRVGADDSMRRPRLRRGSDLRRNESRTTRRDRSRPHPPEHDSVRRRPGRGIETLPGRRRYWP